MKLSVIMPVYNEAENLHAILERIRKVDIDKEILIVDDGSSDGTRELLEGVESVDVKVYHHEENMGKGWAVRTGLRHVTGDIVIIQDADLEYDPADYPRLIQPIVEDGANVVYGSRVLGKNRYSYRRFAWGGLFLTFVTNTLYRTKLTDMNTCYKVFDAQVIKSVPLNCRGFEFCPEVTAKVAKRGYPIVEVPISYEPRSFSQGKKIRWHDGLVGLWTLIRYRLWG